MGVQGRAAAWRWAVVVTILVGATAAGEAQRKPSAVPSTADDRTIVHVLNRIGFGPSPGDVARVREIGLAAYIGQQLNPSSLTDSAISTRLAEFKTLSMSTRDLAREYYIPSQMQRRETQRAQAAAAANPDMQMQPERRAQNGQQGERVVMTELMQQKILRAAYSERQLEEVMVDFWFNHFNVFAGKGASRAFLPEYERDAIRPHVLGSFRELLGAVAESPAMLFYLDNWLSADPKSAGRIMEARRRPTRAEAFGERPRGRAPVGDQGTTSRPDRRQRVPRRNGLNENYARELMELHTLGVDGGYTQKDVQEVARAFSGWTIVQPRQGGAFRFEPRIHDTGEKVVLGHTIGAGGGKEDGEQVLDVLAKHPSTARFIATKLARRFVSDEPPMALIDRAARRFAETNGGIREVVRTIVTSPEFFAPEHYRAKIKTPLEFVVSALRATDAEVTNGVAVANTLRQLGMPLYFSQPPTGYADTADAWVNTGALVNRMNFAVALVNQGIRGVRVDIGRLAGGVNADVARQRLVTRVLRDDLSQATRDTLRKGAEVRQIAALTIGAPEFQRR